MPTDNDTSLNAIDVRLTGHDRELQEFRGQLRSLDGKIDRLGSDIISRMDQAQRERSDAATQQSVGNRGFWVGMGAIAVSFTGVLTSVFFVVGGQALDPIRANQARIETAVLANQDDIKKLLTATVSQATFDASLAEQQQRNLALSAATSTLRDQVVPALAELRGVTETNQLAYLRDRTDFVNVLAAGITRPEYTAGKDADNNRLSALSARLNDLQGQVNAIAPASDVIKELQATVRALTFPPSTAATKPDGR